MPLPGRRSEILSILNGIGVNPALLPSSRLASGAFDRLFPGVKTLVIGIIGAALAAPASLAALLAHVDTTEGRVTTELQFDSAPKNVADFIRLSQGGRKRIDPATGAVTTERLYVGETFFRTADNSFTKFAQTGSGTGTNSGNTGYVIRDEFTPAVRHTGYTLSMANSGPNSNAGQIFFTGNISIPSYDDVHTIIGLVIDPASRAVVDALIAAGDDGSSITGVTIQRTDAAAQAFDESAEQLPEVRSLRPELDVTPGGPLHFNLPSPITATDQLKVYSSTNLTDWSYRGFLYLAPDSSPEAVISNIEATSPSRGFYRVPVVRYPDDPVFSDSAGAQYEVVFADETRLYAFDAGGTGGTVTITPQGGSATQMPFTLFEANHSPYQVRLIVDHGTGTPRYFRYTLHGDSGAPDSYQGRMSSEEWFGFWQAGNSGSCSVTR